MCLHETWRVFKIYFSFLLVSLSPSVLCHYIGHVIIKFFLGWVDLLSYGTPPTRAWSSTINRVILFSVVMISDVICAARPRLCTREVIMIWWKRTTTNYMSTNRIRKRIPTWTPLSLQHLSSMWRLTVWECTTLLQPFRNSTFSYM